MKRLLAVIYVLAALAVAPAASAKVVEMGAGASPAKSNCPSSPCEAIGRVTGYQGRSGSIRNPFRVPHAGRIVAFTVTLAKVTKSQIDFFDGLYGGPASVRLSILRKGRTRRTRLNHRLLKQSKVYDVSHFFGSSPSFALDTPLSVKAGNIVALTVPTWASAFAFTGLSSRNWWRSSRKAGQCRNATQRAAQQRLRQTIKYGCTYRRARLLYTATYVPDPRPTDRSG